jgi:hemoglobin
MKKDIETKEDIKLLVDCFYQTVLADETLAYIFTDIAKVNWQKHLPIMYSFWENTLFYTGTYNGNPMELHKHLHQLTPLTATHFKQWLLHFNTTVDELFNGDKATLAKQRALSIATVMQIKIIAAPSSANNIF